MTKRTIVRGIFIAVGLLELLFFGLGGFKEYALLIGGGMFVFIAATNFCTQCPLLSAIVRFFKKSTLYKIETKKI